MTDPSTITAWETYSTGVGLNRESANYVYIQVKDKAGNTVIYTEGVVVYTESVATTTEDVDYLFKEGNDKEILVNLNGNTVKSITVQDQNPLTRSSESTLVEGTDYVVDAVNDKIIVKAAYLDTLNAKDTAYSFKVKYSPAGIDTDAVDMATTFNIKVSKATLNVASGDVTASGTYGDRLSELSVTGPSVTLNGNPVDGQWVLTGDTVPVVGDTGSYTATFIPNADGDNYEELTQRVVLDIAKAEATYTAPEGKTGLKYQKEVSQALIDEGLTNHGIMKYAIGASSAAAPESGWDAAVPTGINAGTYYVWYKVSGDANHNDSEARYVEVNVGKGETSDVTLPQQEHVYTVSTSGNEVDLSAKIPADRGETVYAVNVAGSNLETYVTNVQVDENGKLTYDTVQASAMVDGLYITVTVTAENYSDFSVKLPIKLSDKEEVIITLPTVQNGEYNHEPHTGYTGTPVVEGRDVAFNIVYEGIGNTQYQATTEKPVNAGDYKVTFTIEDQHAQGTASLEFSITKGTPALADVKANVLENTTNINEITVTYQTNGWSEGQLVIDNGQNLVYGNNSIQYTFTPDDTQNLKVVEGIVDVLVKDTISPSTIISVADKEWKALSNDVTFDLLFNKKQQVTIAYEDNEKGSGLSQKLYYVSDKELTIEELEEVIWKTYEGGFNIEPDGTYVIYAKAIDKDDNISIANTDGIRLDETKPQLSTIFNGESYYGDLKIEIPEEHPDIKEITVDGTAIVLQQGKYTIPADNCKHTIVVTDNAGNQTIYQVNVFKNYDVIFIVDGTEYLKIQVEHGADVELPTIPHKAGYDKTAPKWDHDGIGITEDTVINAIYIKNPDESQDKDIPVTGDNNWLILWSILIYVSLSLVAIISARKKCR